MVNKNKYFYFFAILAIIFIFVVIPIKFFTTPRSEEDIFYKNFEKLSYYKDNMQLSLEYLEVQKDKDCTYYINENSNLLCKKEGSEETLVKGADNFIVDNNKIYYSYLDKDGIYCREIGSQEEIQVLKEGVDRFVIGEDINIIYTWKNKICQYDKKWKKLKEFNVKKQYDDILIYDVLYADGYLVLKSYDSELFAYSIKKNEMSMLDTPIDPKKNCFLTDIIKTESGLYCLTCAYDDADLFIRQTRIDCEENGIYRIDVRNGEFTKVSDDCGFYLWYIDNKLYVQEKYLGNLFSSLKECKMK